MSVTRNASTALTRRRLLAGAAAVTTAMAAPAIVRAQGGMLKVGVLLPRSGTQAGIGQDCYLGVELANPIFKSIGLPELEIMNADTETNGEGGRSAGQYLLPQHSPRPAGPPPGLQLRGIVHPDPHNGRLLRRSQPATTP